MRRVLIIILFCLLTLSCVQVEMQDSSNDPAYAHVIGKQFRIKEDLWATGITTDPNYQHRLDYIVLVPGVGFMGPEVLFREHFGNEAVIRIDRVLTAKGPLSSKVVYVVEEVNTDRFEDSEIRIRLVGSVDDNNLGLDPSIYGRLD